MIKLISLEKYYIKFQDNKIIKLSCSEFYDDTTNIKSYKINIDNENKELLLTNNKNEANDMFKLIMKSYKDNNCKYKKLKII